MGDHSHLYEGSELILPIGLGKESIQDLMHGDGVKSVESASLIAPHVQMRLIRVRWIRTRVVHCFDYKEPSALGKGLSRHENSTPID